MKQWRAVYVASRAEKKINARLAELGMESYVPLKREKKQWSDRKKLVISPLINGYVFIHTDLPERDKVLGVQGVLQYVRFNGGDAIIRDEEIKALKSIEEKGYYTEGAFNAELLHGDTVLIKYGPFKGLKGQVKEKRSELIYTIGIGGLGYSLSVTVPKEVLEKEE